MRLTEKPAHWRPAWWRIYKLGLAPAALILLLPVYLAVGTLVGVLRGIHEVMDDWRYAWRESTG